jgi:tRNA threonylcarbamoyladenosine biosynthesis protein TsaB
VSGDGRQDGGGLAIGGPLLALDTATSTAVAAVGDPGGRLLAAERWPAGHRHGEELLGRVERALAAAGVSLASLGGIVVGTGPGAFTGLRVGLATAKGLAHALGCPIVGIPTGEALLAAAGADLAADAPGPGTSLALLLPAGPADRVLVRPGSAPALLPAGVEPALPAAARLVAVDLDGRAPDAAVGHGVEALAGLPAMLLRLGAARLAREGGDDLAALVPEYVTLPRGVRAVVGEVTWSHDRR